MRDILNHLGYTEVSKANLEKYKKKTGVFVLIESEEIIYVGRSKDLEKRVTQAISDKKDSGSIRNAEGLNDEQYQRIKDAHIYVLTCDDIKGEVASYSIFND